MMLLLRVQTTCSRLLLTIVFAILPTIFFSIGEISSFRYKKISKGICRRTVQTSPSCYWTRASKRRQGAPSSMFVRCGNTRVQLSILLESCLKHERRVVWRRQGAYADNPMAGRRSRIDASRGHFLSYIETTLRFLYQSCLSCMP